MGNKRKSRKQQRSRQAEKKGKQKAEKLEKHGKAENQREAKKQKSRKSKKQRGKEAEIQRSREAKKQESRKTQKSREAGQQGKAEKQRSREKLKCRGQKLGTRNQKNKIQPKNPNAHTYVNGTDVERWICSHAEHFSETGYLNSLVHFSPVTIPVHRRLRNMEEGGVLTVERGV